MILSSIFLALGILFLFTSFKFKKDYSALAKLPNIPFNSLNELYSSDKDLVFEQLVDIEAVIDDQNYLISPISKKSCVYYHLIEKDIIFVNRIDKNGISRWIKQEVIVNEVSNCITFKAFKNENEFVMINPKFAKIENLLTTEKHKYYNIDIDDNTRLDSKIFIENILPICTLIYTAGKLTFDGTNIIIDKSDEIDYIIKNIDKTTNLKQLKLQYKSSFFIGISFSILGILLIISSLF